MRSAGSHSLLQWAVGWPQLWPRLLVLIAYVAG